MQGRVGGEKGKPWDRELVLAAVAYVSCIFPSANILSWQL